MTEYCYHVDEKDNIIGRVKRRDAISQSLLHRGVVIIVVNMQGEILVHKRSRFKRMYPGHYAVGLGGCVNYGESYDECAAREAEEELGIDAPVKFLFNWRFNSEGDNAIVYVYRLVNDGPFNFQPAEIESAQFVSVDELRSMLEREKFCTGDGELFERYVAHR